VGRKGKRQIGPPGGFDPAKDNDVVALPVEYGPSSRSLSLHLRNNGLASERRRQEITEIDGLRLAARLGFRDRVEEERTACGGCAWRRNGVDPVAGWMDFFLTLISISTGCHATTTEPASSPEAPRGR
jgi:hypothetical protein